MDFLKKYQINIENKTLLKQALTHTSYSNEHDEVSYERLEFLGDAVLQIVVSEYLYTKTTLKEGGLSKIRASYVCEHALSQYAHDVGYIPYIRVGEGQKKNVNETIIADVFEAIIAVIYLEKGFDVVKRYIETIISPYIEKSTKFLADYKSILQEMTHTLRNSLEYIVLNESGPAHDKTFEVIVKIDGIVYGKGIGKSKKEAEQNAALDAINKKA